MDLIEPEWPAPAWVRAYASTRQGGVSQGPYASLNLGDHVGDDPSRVARNRALLRERLGLAEAPRWLDQVHGCDLVGDRQMACQTRVAGACQADGAVTGRPGTVCVVMTADCLPVLMCDDRGTRVAAVHAGWRGLAAGILERACAALGGEPARLLVWLGPAIGADASRLVQRFANASWRMIRARSRPFVRRAPTAGWPIWRSWRVAGCAVSG